ncbi:MAG: hypothetical protein M0036_17530 [Desulfobacteraceae bacterium]|nr:hypothetical protein [Desulfobacteraceae bacterium]
MAKKKGKSPSFDAMVKFFMHNYSIPTKRDIEGIVARLERIERLVAAMGEARSRRGSENRAVDKGIVTASDGVLEIIRRSPQGIGFAQIKDQTGFDEKKLRNILFRLNKTGKIVRKSRGIYEPAAATGR